MMHNSKLDIHQIQQNVDSLLNQHSNHTFNSKELQHQYFFSQVNEIVNQINFLSNDIQLDKTQKALLLFFKGKVQQIIHDPSYLKQAEDNISKYLKLFPNDPEAWILLAEIKCKSKDSKGAQLCLQGALQQCGPNKKLMRSLSMVLRMNFSDNEERLKNVQLSVDLAKQAVEIDIQDGESWYILGNAYCSNFFVNQKKLDLLQLSLKVYNYAEKKLNFKCPDLFFNRAQIYSYTEDYQNSLNDLRKAQQLDPNLNCQNSINLIENKLIQLQSSIDSKGKLTQKTLQQLIGDIPCILKEQPNNTKKAKYNIVSLNSLKEGINSNLILSCKVTSLVSNKSDIPASFVFMDFQGNFGVISLYNSSQDLYDKINKYSNIQILDPLLKKIQIDINQRIINFHAIQVFEINNLYVEGQNVIKEFIPNTVFNENFIN